MEQGNFNSSKIKSCAIKKKCIRAESTANVSSVAIIISGGGGDAL